MQLAALALAFVIALTPTTDPRLDHIDRPSRGGIHASTYTGSWYEPRAEPFRRCVIARESGGNYRAANRHSSARGAYQFLDRSWRRGLAHDVAAELTTGPRALRTVRALLRRVPIDQWSRLAQDTAFWVAYRHGAGWRHWYLAGSRCNSLASYPVPLTSTRSTP